MVNQSRRLYDVIVEAFSAVTADGLEAQLVLSLGGADIALCAPLPESAIIVRYAPQRELLRKASLTITHAGLNTTLESLSEGVPMVAIPIAFEQPAIAARISWTRCGEFARSSGLDSRRLSPIIKRVLMNPIFRESALRMKTVIAKTRGAEHAADIVEKVLETRRSVSVSDMGGDCHARAVEPHFSDSLVISDRNA